ncbi:peroxiredoxin family protein [Jeotgalibacillus soli]|uniref:Peroxiredoxin n=1 Tax=Jeotgalibacillus soli TaxID=889306 RepID=A0A0C2S5F0_9BACL|nr:peroxiredoxin family protein [Jeotgalibacillus soli]KIL49259.1 peroxiredoxin [Jeotgalibacillus soli]
MFTFTLGDTTPEFTLPCVSGEHYSFDADQRKRKGWRLLVFFRGAWCPECVHELREIEEHKGFFEGNHVHITAISTDKLENLKDMAYEHTLTFPILSDEGMRVLKSYSVLIHGDDAPYYDHGIHGEPAYFLFDENGGLLYQQRQTGPYGRPSVNELKKIVQSISANLKSRVAASMQ